MDPVLARQVFGSLVDEVEVRGARTQFGREDTLGEGEVGHMFAILKSCGVVMGKSRSSPGSQGSAGGSVASSPQVSRGTVVRPHMPGVRRRPVQDANAGPPHVEGARPAQPRPRARMDPVLARQISDSLPGAVGVEDAIEALERLGATSREAFPFVKEGDLQGEGVAIITARMVVHCIRNVIPPATGGGELSGTSSPRVATASARLARAPGPTLAGWSTPPDGYRDPLSPARRTGHPFDEPRSKNGRGEGEWERPTSPPASEGSAVERPVQWSTGGVPAVARPGGVSVRVESLAEAARLYASLRQGGTPPAGWSKESVEDAAASMERVNELFRLQAQTSKEAIALRERCQQKGLSNVGRAHARQGPEHLAHHWIGTLPPGYPSLAATLESTEGGYKAAMSPREWAEARTLATIMDLSMIGDRGALWEVLVRRLISLKWFSDHLARSPQGTKGTVTKPADVWKEARHLESRLVTNRDLTSTITLERYKAIVTSVVAANLVW
jgi:hypothetical protein